MRKILSIFLVSIMTMTIIASCSNDNTAKTGDNTNSPAKNSESNFDTSSTINVVTREDGSGTREAFTEIVGILEKGENGNETDRTYTEAVVQNSTNSVMTTVTGDEYSIGYISLGSLNDTVKALKIEGTEATAENVQNNSYKISRPFNIAYKGKLNTLSEDFLNFILSTEGQEIVLKEGYVQIGNDLTAYEANGEQEGNLVVAGSTSVTPVMEKLVEAYQEIHLGVSIEIQSTGSSAGMQSTMEGTADLGMASRELKESELAELTSEVIAQDGIAVIVNNSNPTEDLTLEDVKSIYTGETTEWNAMVK